MNFTDEPEEEGELTTSASRSSAGWSSWHLCGRVVREANAIGSLGPRQLRRRGRLSAVGIRAPLTFRRDPGYVTVVHAEFTYYGAIRRKRLLGPVVEVTLIWLHHQARPDKRSARVHHDGRWRPQIQRVCRAKMRSMGRQELEAVGSEWNRRGLPVSWASKWRLTLIVANPFAGMPARLGVRHGRCGTCYSRTAKKEW